MLRDVRYANYSLTYRIIDRVFQARPRRVPAAGQPRPCRVVAWAAAVLLQEAPRKLSSGHADKMG